jgi:hypothetical protein
MGLRSANDLRAQEWSDGQDANPQMVTAQADTGAAGRPIPYLSAPATTKAVSTRAPAACCAVARLSTIYWPRYDRRSRTYRVTIVPRGELLGVTSQRPEDHLLQRPWRTIPEVPGPIGQLVHGVTNF